MKNILNFILLVSLISTFISCNKSNLTDKDYYIIDKKFTDQGGEYTKLVVWVYTADMSKNLEIARKIEDDYPASKFTSKKMWLSVDFFTDKNISNMGPDDSDKIKQLIKINTFSGKIERNESPPR